MMLLLSHTNSKIIRVIPTILREYLFRFNVLIYCVAVNWTRMGGENSKKRERGGGESFSLFKAVSVDTRTCTDCSYVSYMKSLTTQPSKELIWKTRTQSRLLNNAARSLVKLQRTRMWIRAISGFESVKEL